MVRSQAHVGGARTVQFIRAHDRMAFGPNRIHGIGSHVVLPAQRVLHSPSLCQTLGDDAIWQLCPAALLPDLPALPGGRIAHCRCGITQVFSRRQRCNARTGRGKNCFFRSIFRYPRQHAGQPRFVVIAGGGRALCGLPIGLLALAPMGNERRGGTLCRSLVGSLRCMERPVYGRGPFSKILDYLGCRRIDGRASPWYAAKMETRLLADRRGVRTGRHSFGGRRNLASVAPLSVGRGLSAGDLVGTLSRRNHRTNSSPAQKRFLLSGQDFLLALPDSLSVLSSFWSVDGEVAGT